MHIYKIYLFLIFLFSLEVSFGATLNTQCTKSTLGSQIEGLNINKPYTIASVTKVFTSHWAVTRLGPKFRFPTIIHITAVGNNYYNVHLEGALFPYFDKTMYQFLVGELNKLNVQNINRLSFDENFLYATNIRTNPTLAHGNDDQAPLEIIKELRQDTVTLNNGLAALNAKALAIENLKLPDSISISVKEILFVNKKDFQPENTTLSFYLNSSELFRTLKEMNRNSNNFVADKIFKKLSEKEIYTDFVLNQLLNINPNEITLHNGSGYPVMINSKKLYNEASCAAVLEMLFQLKQTMINTGLDLKNIMPVAGKDSVDDGDSTVTQLYGGEITSGALIGKTGSVLDTIALAGIVVTANENTFFQTSFNVDNSPEDRTFAYSKIKDWLTNELLKDKQKSDLTAYVPKSFLSFDEKSQLKRINSFKLRH